MGLHWLHQTKLSSRSLNDKAKSLLARLPWRYPLDVQPRHWWRHRGCQCQKLHRAWQKRKISNLWLSGHEQTMVESQIIRLKPSRLEISAHWSLVGSETLGDYSVLQFPSHQLLPSELLGSTIWAALYLGWKSQNSLKINLQLFGLLFLKQCHPQQFTC